MKLYPIKITINSISRIYDPEFQKLDKLTFAWRNVLKVAYRKATVECLCSTEGDRRLALRYFSDLDLYCLSRYPNTGHNHTEDCRFYGTDKSLTESISKPAIEELPDGTLKIKLQYSLKERDKSTNLNESYLASRKENYSRTKIEKPAISLISLLNLLWDKSGLTHHNPHTEKLKAYHISQKLRKSADIIITKSVKISEVLLVSGDIPDINQRITEHALDNKLRLIIIAQLAKWTPERENLTTGYISLVNFQGIPHVKAKKETWEQTKKKFSHAISAWKAGYKVIIIMQTDTVQNTRFVNALDIALMPVSQAWVPIGAKL